MDAACWGEQETVETLIKAGADVNAKKYSGRTALMWAAFNNYKEVMDALIRAGADVNTKDERGHTVLMYATFNNNKETVDALIRAGADVNAKDENGRTALMHAAKYDYREIIDMLRKAAEQKGAEKSFLLNTRRTLQTQSLEQTSPLQQAKIPEKQQAESLFLQKIKNQAGR